MKVHRRVLLSAAGAAPTAASLRTKGVGHKGFFLFGEDNKQISPLLLAPSSLCLSPLLIAPFPHCFACRPPHLSHARHTATGRRGMSATEPTRLAQSALVSKSWCSVVVPRL
jgi:hypothetical protein